MFQVQNTDTIIYDEEFILNSRGSKLFTCKWLLSNQDPKALVFICHGYAVECSITMRGTCVRVAKAGFEVHGIDFEGHGKSSGLQAYIPSFYDLVDDCSNHFTSICEREENKRKRRFLLGESMGGAVVLMIHRKKPSYWDGAILVAPMCKMTLAARPSALVMNVLILLSKVIPTWKIISTQDIVDLAIKEPQRREEIHSNPYFYKGKVRLKTGYELLKVCLDIEHNLQQVSLPFIILQGEDDKVTDPSISKQLFKSASSSDKTYKLYPGMGHTPTSGEPLASINIAFSDIINWLDQRSTFGSSRLEREQKGEYDTQSPMGDERRK